MDIKTLLSHYRASRWILCSFIGRGDAGVVPSDDDMQSEDPSLTEADTFMEQNPLVKKAVYDILEMFGIQVNKRIETGINPMRFLLIKAETMVAMIEKVTGYMRFLNMEALQTKWNVTGDDESCDMFRELMCECGVNLAHFALVNSTASQGEPITVGDYRVKFAKFNYDRYLSRTIKCEGETTANALEWLQQQTDNPELGWDHVANVYCFFWHSMTCLMGSFDLFDVLEDDRKYFLLLLTLIHDLNHKSNTVAVLTPNFVNQSAASSDAFLVWPSTGSKGDTARRSVFSLVSRAIDIADKFEHNVSVSDIIIADNEDDGASGKRVKDLFSSKTHFYVVSKMFMYVKRLLFEGMHLALQVGLFATHRRIIPYGFSEIEQDRMDPRTFNSDAEFDSMTLSKELVDLSKGSIVTFFASLLEREIQVYGKKNIDMCTNDPVVARMLKLARGNSAMAVARMSQEEFFVLLTRILTLPVPTGLALSELYLHAHKVCYAIYPRVSHRLPTDNLMFMSRINHDEMTTILRNREKEGGSYFSETPLQLTM